MHLRAADIAMTKKIGIDWGLLEAFTQLRSEQAKKLGQPAPADRE